MEPTPQIDPTTGQPAVEPTKPPTASGTPSPGPVTTEAADQIIHAALDAASESQSPVAPVPSEASPEQQTAPETPSSEQPPNTPVEQQPASSPTEPSTASPSVASTESGSTPDISSQPAIQPTATSGAGSEPSNETPIPSADEPEATDSASSSAAAETLPVSPVPAAVIEGIVYRGRTDDDVLTGTFCRVIAGEHQGRYGVFTNTATITLDGWPATVIVRTRDDRDENLTVNYADIRPAAAGGR
ncbi:MAG TPA: hypothetical protein VK730_13615 [Solirubrobacteraceae bacterium]|jgi:hypothetical protein|nr:hypothetical protein [Solirubrobacteraceae bacterium]